MRKSGRVHVLPLFLLDAPEDAVHFSRIHSLHIFAQEWLNKRCVFIRNDHLPGDMSGFNKEFNKPSK